MGMSKNLASQDVVELFGGTVPDPYRPGRRLKPFSRRITEGLPPGDYVRVVLEHFDRYPISGPPKRPEIK